MTENLNTAPDVVHFSSLGFDPDERLERFEAAASPLLRVEPLHGHTGVYADWTLWQASDLVFSKIEFSPFHFERDPKLPGQDQALLLLESYVSGTGNGEIEGQPVWIGPSHFHLADLTRSYRSTTTTSVVHGAVIPHETVGYDPGIHPAYISLSATMPVGRILISAFQAVLSRLPTASRDDATTLANGLTEVIRALLLASSREVDRRVFRGALALTVRAYIDANLNDPELSVAKICKVFGVSRATLYRMMEEFGGIESHVRERRLERCRIALQRAQPEHGGVKRVAHNWGFTDTNRFHRLYKERFGCTPGEDLNRAIAVEVPQPTAPASDRDVVRIFESILRVP
ncbi:MAG: helix-turn-helix domain-containing protein [Pseudomonadota bacterium]